MTTLADLHAADEATKRRWTLSATRDMLTRRQQRRATKGGKRRAKAKQIPWDAGVAQTGD